MRKLALVASMSDREPLWEFDADSFEQAVKKVKDGGYRIIDSGLSGLLPSTGEDDEAIRWLITVE